MTWALAEFGNGDSELGEISLVGREQGLKVSATRQMRRHGGEPNAHAKQFKRHQRELRFLRARLGRLIRDIGRDRPPAAASTGVSMAADAPDKSARSSSASAVGSFIPSMPPRSSASARAKPARPTSSASKPRSPPPNPRTRRSVRPHATALPGNPYDGHTLGGVIAATEQLTGRSIERAPRGLGLSRPQHRAPAPRFHLRPEARRGRQHQTRIAARSAIEAAIGHMKTDGHLGRCCLKGAAGDAANSSSVPSDTISASSSPG